MVSNLNRTPLPTTPARTRALNAVSLSPQRLFWRILGARPLTSSPSANGGKLSSLRRFPRRTAAASSSPGISLSFSSSSSSSSSFAVAHSLLLMARSGGRGAKEGEEEEEHHRNPFLSNSINKPWTSKTQFRSEVSKACWDEEMSMGGIIEKKGSMWATTGVIRNGKLYCHIEEILFLAERGALILTSPDGKTINVGDIYKMILGSKFGCSWESFEAYRHLKSLGYIVQRYGIPWTLKNDIICCSSNSPSENNTRCFEISNLFQDMQISELKPTFEGYLPNSKFRKSSPGDPSFLLCLLSGNPPSRSEVENLEKKCDGLPLKFCYVDHGRFVREIRHDDGSLVFAYSKDHTFD